MKAKIKKTGEIVNVYHESQHGQTDFIYKEAVFVNGRIWQEDELEFIDEDDSTEYILKNADEKVKYYNRNKSKNKLESLKKQINVNNKLYSPMVFITAWGRWCISYRNIFDHKDFLCSVYVEPENKPRKIENTIRYLTEGFGNARSIDDAIDMILKYVKEKETI